MNKVNVGICGLGTVGGGTFDVLKRNAKEIAHRAGAQVDVTHIGMRSNRPEYNTAGIKISADVLDVARDPGVDILVETIGGTSLALELVLEAIHRGKHVVTANKALIAEQGNIIFDAASKKGVAVAYEAAVAGGIPVIRALREGLAANKIKWVAGIVNGTGNFILTKMRDRGTAFPEVLKEAQDLGYAEADPAFDVEGIDAAHKLVILASIAFGISLQFDRAYTQGISEVEIEDVRHAGELGYAIKHLGIARQSEQGIELRVHPTLIPQERLIAKVDGVMNAIMVEGDAVGTTLYYGPGAGAEPTASSVISDIVEIARQKNIAASERSPYLGIPVEALSDEPVLAIARCQTSFYLRFSVRDKPGVLSRVTQLFSDADISVEAIQQKESLEGADEATIVLLTHQTYESELTAIANALEALDVVTGNVIRIRVEALD